MKYDIKIICLNCGKETRLPYPEFMERHGEAVRFHAARSFSAPTFMRDCLCTKGIPAAEHEVTQVIRLRESRFGGDFLWNVITEFDKKGNDHE